MAEARFVRTKYGIFLGNYADPLYLKLKWPEAYTEQGETEFQARHRLLRWMMSKTVGPPLATPEHEEADLRALGYVGVYYNEEAGDEVRSAEEISLSFPAGRTDVDYMGSAVWAIQQERSGS